jgi:hypothetical protein
MNKYSLLRIQYSFLASRRVLHHVTIITREIFIPLSLLRFQYLSNCCVSRNYWELLPKNIPNPDFVLALALAKGDLQSPLRCTAGESLRYEVILS